MIQTVSGKRIRQRINALEHQIANLERAMLGYRKFSRPWSQRDFARKRLQTDIATLRIMLKRLEPEQDASA